MIRVIHADFDLLTKYDLILSGQIEFDLLIIMVLIFRGYYWRFGFQKFLLEFFFGISDSMEILMN